MVIPHINGSIKNKSHNKGVAGLIAYQMLLTALGGRVVRCYNEDNRILCASGVLLLGPEEEPCDDSIYVAEPEAAAAALRLLTPGISPVIFTTGDHPDFPELAGKCSASVCVTDMSLVSLHNELHRRLELYRSWREILDHDSSKGITVLIQNGAKLADASVYLLNPQREIVTGSKKTEHNEHLRSVIDYNYTIVGDSLNQLFDQLDNGGSFAEEAAGENGLHFCALPVKSRSELLGYLLAASEHEPAVLREILYLLSIRAEIMLSKTDAGYDGRMSFQVIAQDIFSDRDINFEELQMRLQRLPSPPKKFVRCILIRPRNSLVINMNKLISEAEHIFPACNATILDDEVVILISSDYSSCPLTYDMPEFDNLLQKYDAHAIISNPTKTVRGLRIMYRQCRGLFEVVLKVQRQDSNRYFMFEHYLAYYIIHLCAQQAKAAFGTDDIVFLAHPGVLAVTRYDRTYNSDLRDVLFAYLMNRCSISRTAKAMYMHRNTIIYKINKIEEILGQPIDDPSLRFALIFSCMLIRYRENYQNEHVQLSVFERTTP